MAPRFLVVAVASLTLLSPGSALGDYFGIDLPELVGFIPPDGVTVSFDFGQEFASVREVILIIDGITTPLQFDSCGYGTPQPCTTQTFPGDMVASFADHATRAIIRNLTNYRRTKSDLFQDGMGSRSEWFDHLRGGVGEFGLGFSQVYYFPELIVRNYVSPTAIIYRARLVIEADPLPTPVPEPAAVLQAFAGGLGLLALTWIRSRRCAQRSATGSRRPGRQ